MPLEIVVGFTSKGPLLVFWALEGCQGQTSELQNWLINSNE